MAGVKFKDLNFKLAVIEQLMFCQDMLPHFNVREFMKERGSKFNPEMKAFSFVPGTKAYFRNYELTPEMLEKVEIIDQNYHKIYHQMIPYWDGEGDEFNIRSAEDVKLLPNLKEAILLYDHEQKMVDEFKSKGINARYL